MKLRWTRHVKLIMCFVLLFALFTPSTFISADGGGETISIQTDIKVTLHNKQLIKQDNSKVAMFTLHIDNQSNDALPLIDYWARIKGGSSSYITKLVPLDVDKAVVMPKNEMYLSFYAVVGQSETLDNLKLELIKWDFSMTNYERILGSLSTSKIQNQKYQTTATINYAQYYFNAKVVSYTMLEEAEYNRLNFKLHLSNATSKKTSLAELKFMMETNDGTLYDTDSALSTLELRGNESKYINLSVYVPKQKNLKDSKLRLMSVEEKVDLPITTFDLPNMVESKPVKHNTFKTVSVNQTNLQVKSGKSEVTTENKRTILESVVTMINKSTTPLDLPSFTYYLKTTEGYMYPLVIDSENESEQDIKLLPNIEQEIKITGQIPSNKAMKNGQLVIFLKTEDQEQLVQNFNVVVTETETPDDTGVNESIYDGNLITFSSTNRVPKGTKDIVVSEFIVRNISNKAKSKLDIKGQFILDGVKLDSEVTKIFSLTPNFTIQSQDQYRIIAYFEIPYTQNYDKLRFEMIDGEKKVETFDIKDMTSTKLLASNQKYQLTSVGKRADITYNKSRVYEGIKDNLFVAEFGLTNTETRNVIPANLSGYIQNAKGEILNLEFEKLEETVLPGGKVTLLGSVAIPKTFDSKNVEIHIGEQLIIDENSVMINPVYTKHLDIKKVQPSISEPMIVQDYEFKINSFEVDWYSADEYIIDGIQMFYEYSLNYSQSDSKVLGERKLIIEYQDFVYPKVNFSRAYSLGESEGENVLRLGTGTHTIQKVDSSFRLSTLENYQINVYEEYKGYKVLIASESFN